MDRLGTATVNLGAEPTEAQFQTQVIQLAKHYGWRVAHFRPGMTKRGTWVTAVQGDGKGFPDLVLVRGPVLLFAELKAKRGILTAEQKEWLTALNGAGVVACVWRPADWNAIIKELTP